jgi:predicted SAM-dependent methyltransferase
MLQVVRSMVSRIKRSLLGGPGPSQREWVAAAYLRGRGLEVGALHNPLKVPHWVQVTYVDRMPVSELRRQYPDLARLRFVEVAIVDDGERLDTVADASQDFVIANHFLEHCADPIGTVKSFLRVLRPAGVLYLAVPDKRYTFDRDRPVTSLEHLRKDHEAGPGWSRRQHFMEWARLVDKVTEPAEVNRYVERLLAVDYSIHYHVWTQAEFLEFLGDMKKALAFEVELFLKHGHEMIVVLRKESRVGDHQEAKLGPLPHDP